jgi:hypothetical protein
MQEYNMSLMPTAVSVTLYRYNYIDNKIWAQIQNDLDFIENSDGTIQHLLGKLK